MRPGKSHPKEGQRSFCGAAAQNWRAADNMKRRNENATNKNKEKRADTGPMDLSGFIGGVAAYLQAEVAYAATSDVEINETTFPDAAFLKCVKTYDSDNDNILSETELQNVTSIDVSKKGIADLTGIEHFTALTTLDCQNNQLSNLDVSQNTALELFYCSNNQLKSLDVSQNTALRYLYCDNNQLSNLNVSQNTALELFVCSDNQLKSLDVSQNTALKELHCRCNQLSDLKLGQNVAMYTLYCDTNQLSGLDVSGCSALVYFYCDDNQLSSLDVSKNSVLGSFTCDNNQLSSLDVSKNPVLDIFSCENNQLSSLDVTQNPVLRSLCCRNNQLRNLDVTQNVELEFLACQENWLNGVDTSKNTKLTTFQYAPQRSTGKKQPQTIALPEASITKTLGDNSFSLNAKLTVGDGALTYASSNENIAIVSPAGMVTLKGTGTANITIRASETTNYDAAEAIVRLTVNPKTETVKITAIQLSAPSKKIAAGKKVKLTAQIFPANAVNKKLEWKSSNLKVAKVDQKGNVTMLKKSGGQKVTITASATDGSGKKATYKLTSMKGAVKKLSVTGKKTVKAGKTIKLKAKVSASKGANKKVAWSSSNTKYAEVSANGTVKTFKAGKNKRVKITCRSLDGTNKKKTFVIKIK